MTSRTKAEVLAEAERWDALSQAYRNAGLCAVCAAQAAYGSQLGFENVQRPCYRCKPRVAQFAGAQQPRNWRLLA